MLVGAACAFISAVDFGYLSGREPRAIRTCKKPGQTNYLHSDDVRKARARRGQERTEEGAT